MFFFKKKQGRIHGNPVADGWAGAVLQKLVGIQKCDGSTDQLTWQGVELSVRNKKLHKENMKALGFIQKILVDDLWYFNLSLKAGVRVWRLGLGPGS